MLEALFILGGGSLVLGVVGALRGLDSGIQRTEAAVVNYGRQVEARTRTVVTVEMQKEGDRRVKRAVKKTSDKWARATKRLQDEHELDITKTAESSAKDTVQQLISAGWRPSR